ncbi:MAG TPA: ATP-binding protein [Solirubrobacteraceae bacterium]|nr:ATP-binding protein [Solirubrobacteraceae bacterium]
MVARRWGVPATGRAGARAARRSARAGSTRRAGGPRAPAHTARALPQPVGPAGAAAGGEPATARVALRADRRAPRAARAELGSIPGLEGDVRATAQLLVSELVTNAVRHAGRAVDGDIELRIFAGAVLRVEVADGAPGLPQVLVESGPGDDGGRGLLLVARLARAGAPSTTPRRGVVELDLPSPGPGGPQATIPVQPRGG